MAVDNRFLKVLRTVGIIEGCSTIVLFFVAMPLKYMADMPVAVSIAGAVHGVLFLALVALFVAGRTRIPLPSRLVSAGILGAVVPFGPFVVDARLKRLAG